MSDKLINQLPNQNLTQADADTQAGVYRKSPITALMQQCSSGRRHSVTLNLPDNSIIPLWVRKPGNDTIERLSSANNGGNEQDSVQLDRRLIMDYYDRKVVDEGHETDFVPAFPASDEPQLKQLSSAVIKELVNAIHSFDSFYAQQQQCNSGRRHLVILNLPDGSVIPLWVRKPGNNTIKRLSSASNYQLIMDYYDRKVADEGHETDFVPAFPASDEPQLRQLSSAVIKELVDVILEL